MLLNIDPLCTIPSWVENNLSQQLHQILPFWLGHWQPHSPSQENAQSEVLIFRSIEITSGVIILHPKKKMTLTKENPIFVG